MVEQGAVNAKVAGSSPASGAKQKAPALVGAFCFVPRVWPGRQQHGKPGVVAGA